MTLLATLASTSVLRVQRKRRGSHGKRRREVGLDWIFGLRPGPDPESIRDAKELASLVYV